MAEKNSAIEIQLLLDQVKKIFVTCIFGEKRFSVQKNYSAVSLLTQYTVVICFKNDLLIATEPFKDIHFQVLEIATHWLPM